MMKSEFEQLALRNNATIGATLYESIERFYMSDNEYHATHGGVDESKQDFVKRVFGGKVNTPNSIVRKIADEAIKENRYALRGIVHTEERLAEMDRLIREHYNTIFKYDNTFDRI